MKISLIQTDIAWGDAEVNRMRAGQLMRQAPGSDLYVLPEMWSTGFMSAPEQEPVEPENGPSVQWMREQAQALDAAIAGSVAVKAADGSYRNRFYFVKPCGEVVSYDKHHLFTYSGEDQHYTPGAERVTVEWRGVRFFLQVCYDLRFPIFSRNTPVEPYDVALYVASWPVPRIQVWHTLLQARALENQCYVCGVNRTGTDPACQYNGGTQCIDPYGRVVAALPEGEEGAVTVELNLEKLQSFRKKFPVLNDRD